MEPLALKSFTLPLSFTHAQGGVWYVADVQYILLTVWVKEGMNDPGLEVASLDVTLASIPNSRLICFVLELRQFGFFFSPTLIY